MEPCASSRRIIVGPGIVGSGFVSEWVTSMSGYVVGGWDGRVDARANDVEVVADTGVRHHAIVGSPAEKAVSAVEVQRADQHGSDRSKISLLSGERADELPRILGQLSSCVTQSMESKPQNIRASSRGS